VDAIGVGSDTVLVDDPALAVREVYRERPLARVVFDRRLRTPPSARLFSTLQTGPVIILTSPETLAARTGEARALERSGATIVPVGDPGLTPMLRRLLSFDVHSVMLEGGAAIHASAWDEAVVDYVQLYVTPHVLGPEGLPLLDRRPFSPGSLIEARINVRGPDVIIEGYVHRPH
jgi:diaminohydroxyphosphoribosylaminopyrimidine deaminase/5-amino-6-(5-phosphoribosylamino)uracil reductase